MARAIEHAHDDFRRLDALGGGERLHVFGGRLVEIDHAIGIARADRDLVHIDVGRVEQAAVFGNRQYRERVGAGFGGDGGAFERVERDVDARRACVAQSDLLADVQHRGLVALALADDDLAVDIQRVQRRAHGVDGQLVSLFLVAATDLGVAGDGGQFGDPGGVGGQR